MTINKMEIPVYHVDAFTAVPFKGNPAAVCLLKTEIDDGAMKAIAAEMGLSETAFVYMNGEQGKVRLRWFSPEREMPLCGHATLAASKVLFEELGYGGNVITYSTLSGDLTVIRAEQGMIMEFPLDEPISAGVPEELLRAVGISRCKEAFLGKATSKLVIVADSTDEVLNIRPDYAAMRNFDAEAYGIKGVGVTVKGEDPYDFVSRYFNPWAGVNEDPVTGSVHTVLAAYWADKLGKSELKALQASKRQGEITIRVRRDNRVELMGDAVIVVKGNLYINQ